MAFLQQCFEQEILSQLKHKDAIEQFFELFFDDGMCDEFKIQFVYSCLNLMGKEIIDFDNDLQTGVDNGYSIGFQLQMVKELIVSK
ncbi:hypothetical protein PQI64_12770 [Shewanella bicestrii]